MLIIWTGNKYFKTGLVPRYSKATEHSDLIKLSQKWHKLLDNWHSIYMSCTVRYNTQVYGQIIIRDKVHIYINTEEENEKQQL